MAGKEKREVRGKMKRRRLLIGFGVIAAGATLALTGYGIGWSLSQGNLILTSVIVAMLSSICAAISAAAGWRSVRETQLAREMQERPYVIMDFDLSDKGIINLVVKNIGNGSAKDVKFNFLKPMITSDGRDIAKLPLFEQGLRFLPAGKEISQFFDTSVGYFGDARPPIFEVSISYYNGQGSTFYEDPPIKLDLSAYKGMYYIQEKDFNDLVKEVENISKHLRDMVSKLERVTKGLENGLHIDTYEFRIVGAADKKTILSKLTEVQNVWNAWYKDSTEQFMIPRKLQPKLESLGYQIVNLAAGCTDLADEDKTQLLEIAARVTALSRQRFYMDGGESLNRFNASGTEFVALIDEIKPKLEKSAERSTSG